MIKITLGLALFLGLLGCSSSGTVSGAGRAATYDLPTVIYEKHEAVVYPAGPRD
nr:hypothetical protein [Desulfobulbaceae bacterium]